MADEQRTDGARKPRAVKLHGDANGRPGLNRVVLAKEDYRRLLYEDARYVFCAPDPVHVPANREHVLRRGACGLARAVRAHRAVVRSTPAVGPAKK